MDKEKEAAIEEKRILYIGWHGHGNLGDDLLFEIFKLLVRKGMESHPREFRYAIDTVNTCEADHLERYDAVVLGGGSLFSMPEYIDICINAADRGAKLLTWGTGIDMRYIEKTTAVMEDFKSGVRSSAMNDLITNYDSIKKMLEKAHKITVRGELTKFMLDDPRAEVIGDPGIVISKLLDEECPGKDPDLAEACSSQKRIGFNWGTVNNFLLGMDENNLLLQAGVAVSLLAATGYQIVLFPMCEEDIAKCRQLYDALGSENVILIEKVLEIEDMVSLFRSFRCSVNMKLHANIISMSVGRPFVSLAYGLKCFDFADSVGLAELALSTDSVTSKQIVERVGYIEEHYRALCSRMAEHAEFYHLKHITNIDEMFGGLI